MYRLNKTLLTAALALLMLSLSCKTGTSNVKKMQESDTDPEPSYLNGVAVLDAGADKGKTDYEKAFAYFENACRIATPHDVSEDPNNPRVSKDLRKPQYFYNAGWTAARLGRVSDAEGFYLEALEVDSGYTPALVNLASLYAESGRPAKAADLYEQYLDDHPDDVKMMLNLAGALGEAGDMEGAEKWIQQVLFNEPDNDMAYKVLARAYYQIGKYDMAILLNDMAAALKEEDSEIQNTMGLTYLQMGDEVLASEKFKKARELDPNNLEANLNLGYLALESGDYQLAAECFQAVLDKYPGSADAHLGMAVAYRGIADFDSAVAEYDAILKADPGHKLALLNKAKLQDSLLKDFKASRATLDAYVQANGHDATVDELIALVDTHQMEKEEAEAAQKEFERMMAERKKAAEEAAKVLRDKVDRAYLLFDLYGERADKIDFSFNQALDFYVLQAEDAIAVPDDPDYIKSCEGYLETYIVDEYLRALDENEKLKDWTRPRAELWTDPNALKEEAKKRGIGTEAPADGGGMGTDGAAPLPEGAGEPATEGAGTETPAEGAGTETPAEGAESETPAEGAESETPAEGAESETPAEGAGTETPAEGAGAETPAEGDTTTPAGAE